MKNGQSSLEELAAENQRLKEENERLRSFVILGDERQRFSEMALKAEVEKFRLLIEESSDPIFSFSHDGRYLYVNKAFATGVGMDQGQIIGNRIWDVFPKDEADKRYAVLEQVFLTGEEKELEVRVPREGGDLFFLTTVTPIFSPDNNGNVELAICISKNITKRKIAEIKILDSEEKLSIANATKDKFFSLIAHDLRSPFNAILGFSDMLSSELKQLSSDEVEELATNINKSARSVFGLLGNLLQWARSQSGVIAFNPRNADVVKILNESIEMVENDASRKSIRISLTGDHQLDAEVDYNMLATVFRNILSNAIKFTPQHGQVDIGIHSSQSKTGGLDHWTVCFKDSGIGMTQEQVDQLFDVSFVKSTPGTEGENGSGLGLLLCKEFVGYHNGTIRVQSERGKGSQFIVEIPFA